MKRLLFSLVLLLSVILATACSSEETKTSLGKNGKEKVIIAEGNTGFLLTPIYVAKEQGFFEEEGLEVEEVSVSGGSKALSAVIGGGAQIGTVALVDIMKAIDSGQNVKVFGTLFNQVGTNIVMNKDIASKNGINENSSMADKIKALKGLKVGISSPGSGSDHIIRMLLESEGINPDRDSELIPLGQGDAQLAAFQKNEIDAFVYASPTTDMATTLNGIILFNFSKGEVEEYAGLAYLTLVAKEDDLKKNKELYQKVANAMAKAGKFIETEREETREILKKYVQGIDPEVFDIAFENNYPAFAKSPVITEESFNKNIKFGGIDLPFDKVIDNEFADKAK
ncbi:ABC transporter substrate-binding protein [Cytobacillus depressus]|uniref:ABC transporter substrate-binding protein n=1 Tax=Cytobacillus depressus TaxID=1602942 RepID=UPI00147903AE|nr:ABC transporter substrate-binding protein [Cytobacillus depressus]